MQVLQGTKKLLNIGCLGGYNIPYFSKNKVLTKQYIFDLFIDDIELKKYIPDELKLHSITRELLLSILACVRKDKYLHLYSIYKQIKVERTTGNNKLFSLNIDENYLKKLSEYRCVNK